MLLPLPICNVKTIHLFFHEASEEEIKNVKVILICYEAVSDLKINFYKSELIGIEVEEVLMHLYAEVLGCKVGSLHATYLGLRCV